MSSAIFLEEPPGISHVALMSIQWSGTGFCLMVIAVRLAIRWKIFSRLKIDDYFAVVGALLNLASSILWTIIGNSFYGILDGSDESMTSQRALGEVGLILRGHLIGAALMWSCLWSIKLSFMAFFHGLGSRIKSQRILWWSILVFVVISYVICISVLDYQCIASKGSEISKNCPSSHVAGREYAGTRVTTSLDIATDVAIMIVSGNIVWRARIALKKKLALAFICSLTFVVIVISIIRLIRVAGTADISRLVLWNSLEMTIAIFVACIASFRSLYGHTKNFRQDRGLITLNHWPEGSAQPAFNTDMVSDDRWLRACQRSHESQDILWADQKAPGTKIVIPAQVYEGV